MKWIKTKIIGVLIFLGIIVFASQIGGEISTHPVLDLIKATSTPSSKIIGQEIAKIKKVDKVKRDDYFGGSIEIVKMNAKEWGVEVFIKAWDEKGQQIAFGDGTVEIERVNIVNPPILIEDSEGDIVNEWTDELTGEPRELRQREDLHEALLKSLSHTIKVMKKKHTPENIVLGKIGKTTSTFYPDANVESDTVDGSTRMADATWATAQNGAGEWFKDDRVTEWIIVGITGTPEYQLDRNFFYFKTGATIPVTDDISSAVFSVHESTAEVVNNGDNDGSDFIAIVQVRGDQVGSDTALANTDFQYCGSAVDDPTEAHDAGERKDLTTDITVNDYNDWNFNSTGIGWIARGTEQKPSGGTAGITYLGTREGHDITDDAYAGANGTYNGISIYFADNGSDQPKLVVEHTEAVVAEDPALIQVQTTGNW